MRYTPTWQICSCFLYIQRRRRSRLRVINTLFALAMALAVSVATAATPAHPAHARAAPLPNDAASVVETLGTPGLHWFVVNDFDGKARLFNGDNGRMLGMLSTSPFTPTVEIDIPRGELLTADGYYERGTRGKRTDVVSVYSLATLAPLGEVVIPAKVAAGLPHRGYTGLLDGGRFMTVYNFSPAMSVTVVDLQTRKLAQEISTPGCGLTYPASADSFLQLCGDGTMQRVRLAADGTEAGRDRSKAFFSVLDDPLTEKGVRNGDHWLFVTFTGRVFSLAGADLTVGEPWSLTDATSAAGRALVRPVTKDAKEAGWRVGGWQHLALHRTSGELLALMHQGGANTHKDPGTEVWVYNVASHKLLKRFKLKTPAMSLEVSQDAKPLFYAGNPVTRAVEVYGLDDGKLKRTISDTGVTALLESF